MTEPAKPSLLIVEDDERIRYLVVAAAERCGQYGSIRAVVDGQAAFETVWEAVQRDPGALPAIVLTDLSMPRFDGLQLIQELKRHLETRDIPVFMMTSSNRPNDREDALAAGCAAFFEKPARFDGLLALVRQLPGLCDTPAERSA